MARPIMGFLTCLIYGNSQYGNMAPKDEYEFRDMILQPSTKRSGGHPLSETGDSQIPSW